MCEKNKRKESSGSENRVFNREKKCKKNNNIFEMYMCFVIEIKINIFEKWRNKPIDEQTKLH